MKSLLLPRLRDILFLSIFIAAILLGPRMLNADGDLPRHLAIGKYVLQGNLPPVNDIFSFTRYGTPFAPHKWLSGVFFYLAYLSFDERGIVILSALLLAATFTLIYSDGVDRTGVRLPVLFLVTWGAAMTSLHWISRPHLFTMLFLAIWLILNERLAGGRKVSIWYFAAIMFLWNNIHGEFIAGFLITGATLAGWIWEFIFHRSATDLKIGKRLGILLVTITAVTLINPVSLRAWSTVTSWMGNDYLMSHTEETLPPNFADPQFLILLVFLVVSILILVMKRNKLPARMAFLLAGFSAMVLTSARNIHFFGVVAPFVLASVFSKEMLIAPITRFEMLIDKVEKNLRGFVWPATTIFAGIILLAATPVGKMERFSPDYFPIQATRWLKDHPQNGNMFNPFDWGGYLSLELWPDYRVFIDSQGDVYGEAFIREYEKIITLGDGWQEILVNYDVDWAMVPEEWNLTAALDEAGWLEVYHDSTAVIFVRGE